MKIDNITSTLNSSQSKHQISNLLCLYTILCTLGLSIALSALQLAFDFHQDSQQTQNSLTQIETAYLAPMAVNIWNVDKPQLKKQVTEIAALPGIQFIRLQEVIGNNDIPLIEAGQQGSDFDINKKLNLIYGGKIVGKLFVGASLSQAYANLEKDYLTCLITHFLKALLLSIFILLIVYYTVLRHINKIALHTKNFNIHNYDDPLILDGKRSLSRPDEIDALVLLLNQMQKKIITELSNKKIIIEELQQERDFSAMIINSSSTIICCLSTDLKIATINPSAVMLTGYIEEELHQKNWLDIFVTDQLKEEMRGKLNENEIIQSIEIDMHDQMGELHTLLWTFSPFYDGMKLKYIIGFGHDITAQKQVELEITKLNDQLENKVNTRTAALTKSNQQITQTLEQLKRTQQTLVESEKMASLGELVAGVAHEINTPIGISVTASTFLQDEITTLNDKLSANTLTRSYMSGAVQRITDSGLLLNNNLNRAANLISSFKQVAVDQSSEACYSFKLANNVNQVITSLEHKVKQSNCQIRINCPSDLAIYSFPGSFVQIYSNLILNSLIHGFDQWEGKRHIFIDIQKNKNTLHIDYQDTGKGIPNDVKKRMFDPFVTSKRGAGGSGLGMHIIYNIIKQLLKGNIQCIDQQEGVHFKIEIPYITS